MAARHSVATPFRLVAHAAKDGAMGAATRRSFATSALRAKEIAGDTPKANKSNLPEGDVSELPNLRHAQRGPQGKLHAPIVNPTDKVAHKADSLHQYGQYLLSCLPKYIQQFSVWKDEHTI
ncbi:hypothetical protein KC336_g19237, partial [Hortaea werneckii]